MEYKYCKIASLLLLTGVLAACVSVPTAEEYRNALQSGTLEEIQQMIKNGADVESRFDSRYQRFHAPILTESGYGRVVTPLMIVTVSDNGPAILQALVDAGANVDATTDGGLTELIYASSITSKFPGEAGPGRRIHAKLLIGSGADVNASDVSGLTPLMVAAMTPWPLRAHMIKTLLDAGADTSMINADGKTAYMLSLDNMAFGDEERQLLAAA